MKILDTDLLIGILKKNSEVKEKLRQIESSNEPVAITIFNAEEILFGSLLTKHKKANYKISQEFISGFDILPYDIHAMEEAVKIKAYLRKKGISIGVTDERIGGIAIRNNATIVTRNTRHFSKIPELKVEKW